MILNIQTLSERRARQELHDMIDSLDVEGLAYMCSELTDYEQHRVIVRCDDGQQSAAHHAGRCLMCYQPEEIA